MDKPKLPRLFHLLRECPEHAWIDGEQVEIIDWSEDGRLAEVSVEDGTYSFEDQDVDLLEGTGKVVAVDGIEPVEVDFECPYPVRVTNENWENLIPTKETP